MTYDTFLDLCIMAGCDFNENIPKIGMGRAFPLLKSCKKIEALPEKYLVQSECLNQEKCRAIFGYEMSKNLTEEIKLHINLDLSESRDKLVVHGCEYVIESLLGLYKNFQPAEESKVRQPIKAKLIFL